MAQEISTLRPIISGVPKETNLLRNIDANKHTFEIEIYNLQQQNNNNITKYEDIVLKTL